MRSQVFLALLPALLLAPASSAAEQVAALVGATIHPVSGAAIENGAVVMEGGLIRSVGDAASAPSGAKVIQLDGKHVYPGLIAPYTQLGLVEINSVRATLDFNETGAINPNAHAHKSFNPDSELIPVTRSGGVLLAVAAPAGGRVSGCSSLMQLAGWTWEEMLVKPDVGLHITWPRAPRGRDEHSHDDQQQNSNDEIDKLDLLFDQAEAYHKLRKEAAGKTLETDLRLDALGPVLSGDRPVIVTADGLAEIEAAVAFCVRRGLKLILHGGYDAPLCADLLTEHDVPVIVGSVLRLPHRRSDPYNHAYTLPARLHEAGVRFCIAGDRQDQDSNVRNLPHHAGTAAAFGLPREAALRAITLAPAEILGVADQVGSLEPGKHATLIVTDGDPLEIATHVERAWVQGEEIDLTDRHKRLYEKFKQRLEE